MILDQFWGIVEEVHRSSGGDMDAKCELLDKRLRQLSIDEVLSFTQHFTECKDRAYSWELWAAAYIIGGGCSDDISSHLLRTARFPPESMAHAGGNRVCGIYLAFDPDIGDE